MTVLTRMVVMIVFALCVTLPASGQEVTNPDGTTIQWTPVGVEIVIPSGWVINAPPDSPIELTNDAYRLLFFTTLDDSADPEAELERVIDLDLEGMTFSPITDFEFLGRTAYRFDSTSEETSGFMIGVRIERKVLMIVGSVAADAFTEDDEAFLFDVLNQMSLLSNPSTLIWGQGRLAIDVPLGWEFTDPSLPSLTLSNDVYVMGFFVIPHDPTSDLSPQDDFESTLNDVLGTTIESFGDIDPFPLDNLEDTPAFVTDFISEGHSGVVLMVSQPDYNIFILGTVENEEITEEQREEMLSIVRGIELVKVDPASQPPTTTDTSSYAPDADELIAQLTEQGLIPDGDGEFIFTEEVAISSRNPIRFDAAYDSPIVVMGANISWRPVEWDDSDYGNCILIAQADVSSDDNPDELSQILFAGLDSENYFVVTDISPETAQAPENVAFETKANVYHPVHLLVIINDGQLTAFVDGEMVAENFEVKPPENGPSYAGYYLFPGCVMSNIWAYTVEE